jgi:hypothetical protein
MTLIKEINEGLERTLKQVWKKLANPREISNMKLVYYPDYDRVMYQLSGPSLRKTPFGIHFSKTLAYKLGTDPSERSQHQMDQRELLGEQYHGSVRESEIHVRVL